MTPELPQELIEPASRLSSTMEVVLGAFRGDIEKKGVDEKDAVAFFASCLIQNIAHMTYHHGGNSSFEALRKGLLPAFDAAWLAQDFTHKEEGESH